MNKHEAIRIHDYNILMDKLITIKRNLILRTFGIKQEKNKSWLNSKKIDLISIFSNNHFLQQSDIDKELPNHETLRFVVRVNWHVSKSSQSLRHPEIQNGENWKKDFFCVNSKYLVNSNSEKIFLLIDGDKLLSWNFLLPRH